jgi:hypothetical protein
MSSGVLPCCNSQSLEPKEPFTSRGKARKIVLAAADPDDRSSRLI